MPHSQHFTIVGFCDAAEKHRGDAEITFFKTYDQYGAEHIPRPDELRRYAEQGGYYPSGKRGAVPGHCEPIYHVHGSGHEYLACPECWPVPSRAEGRLA